MADRGLHPNVEISNSGKREYKGRIYAFLRTSLRFGLAHRWSFVFAMIGLLALSIFGYGYMRQGFFPLIWSTISSIWNTNCRKEPIPRV